MPFGAAIGAIGAIGAAAITASAAGGSSQQAAGGYSQAANVAAQQFAQTQKNLQPYQAAGTNALAALQTQLGLGPGGTLDPNAPLTRQFTAADFQQSPGYQFQLQQGINAIDQSAAARGFTGNTLKDLTTFGTGLANQDWWNAYNAYTQNQQRQYGNLGTLAAGGQNAAVNTGRFGQYAANQIGAGLIGQGAALGAGQVAQGNAFTGLNNSLFTQLPGIINAFRAPSGGVYGGRFGVPAGSYGGYRSGGFSGAGQYASSIGATAGGFT